MADKSDHLTVLLLSRVDLVSSEARSRLAARGRRDAVCDAAAQIRLGRKYFLGEDVSQDYSQAAFWFRKAADQGNAHAQLFLGLLYSEGWGVAQDFEEAAIWYRKAADEGNADAQWALGSMYSAGDGVPQDYTSAAIWY